MLFFVNLIRSGIIVDKSLLPRFFLLSLLLLGSWLGPLRKKRIFQNSFFEISFLLFYLWNLVSSFWAIAPSESIMQSQMVFLSFAVFATVAAFQRNNKAFENIFIRIHLVALILSFGLAFYKMSTLEFYDPYKIVSVSANNNLYAGFLVLSLPFVLTGYSINRGFWKFLSVAVAVLSVFFIIIIQSRAAYLALAAGSITAAIVMGLKYRDILTRKNLLTGTVAILLLASGVTGFYLSLDRTRQNYFLSKVPVWQYFKSYDQESAEKMLALRNKEKATNSQLTEFDFAEAYHENASLRMIFWGKSEGLVKLHPITGVGAGSWRLHVPAIKEPPNPEHTARNFTYSQPHNEWIGLLSELGLIGFLLALCVFFLPLGTAFREIFRKIPAPHISTVFYASFILGFYLFASFDFPFRRVEHNVLLFSALVFLLARLDFHRRDAETLRLPDRRSTALRLCVSAVKKTLFALILIFTLILATARLHGEYYTLKMFQQEGKNDDQVIEYAQKAENVFYKITPNTLPLAWFEGVAWYHKGDVYKANACFEKALEITPFEVRLLNDYGASLFSLKRAAEAKTVLLKTLEMDPFFDDARFNLGAMYYFTGNRDSARFHINKCRNSQKKIDFLKELDAPSAYPQ
jgi:tetratricopeptide (TPR) repeat protein